MPFWYWLDFLTAILLDLATVVSMISFGALIAFTAVNFSVFMHFYQVRTKAGTIFLKILYLIFSVAAIVCLWFNLDAAPAFWLCLAQSGNCYFYL
jgi:putrescine importer